LKQEVNSELPEEGDYWGEEGIQRLQAPVWWAIL